jgi:sugar phosphate isomerase/epimerase
MQLAFATSAFRRFSLDEALAQIARAGYPAAEIMCDAPHAYPEQLSAADRRAIRATLRELGLAVSNLNAFMMTAVHGPRPGDDLPRQARDFWYPSYVDPDPAERRKRIEHTKGCLQLAQDLGSPSISIEPGGPLDGRDEAVGLTLFEQALDELAPLAESLGVSVCIEPEPSLLIERTDQYLRFMERIDSAAVAMNFDVGHLYCVGEEPAEAVRRLGGQIRHIQIEDIAPTRVHRHLAPGDGAIDFVALRQALADTGYDGYVTVELYPYLEDPAPAATTSLDRLRSLGYHDQRLLLDDDRPGHAQRLVREADVVVGAGGIKGKGERSAGHDPGSRIRPGVEYSVR